MNHKKQTELNQEIQSEKQRMDRDQDIRVPYHKPKQYSLKEFLARRTLNKPPQEGKQVVSSIVALKMNSDQLEKFAQKMKEREEEALEFFRSESESDDEEKANKENVTGNVEIAVVVDEKPNDTEKIAETGGEVEMAEPFVEEPMESAVVLDIQPCEVNQETEPKVDLTAQKDEIVEVLTEAENSEDPDFERLREKYKNFSEEPEDKPTLPALSLKTLNEIDSKDFVINLETGSVEKKKLTGPEMLFQKYLKTVQKPKHKNTVSMNILTVENGKLENQKVEVKLAKEIELDHQRPGFSHEKMKETLRNKIVHKRLEEIKKKLRENETKELEPEDKEKCGEVEEEMEDDDEDFEGEECDEESSEEEDEEEEMEACVETKRKKKGGGAFLDEEVSKV